MREDDLRGALLIRAIEDADRAGTLLPPGERAQATREALRALGATADQAASGADEALLARALGDRAERLVGPLTGRHPIVAEVLGRTHTTAWVLAGLLAVAFAGGLGLSALDGSRRINILALPFLGLVAWNLVAYVAFAVAWSRRRRDDRSSVQRSARWLVQLVARRIGPLVERTARVDVVLSQALGRYAAAWAESGSTFVALRVRRALHLAAAAVALGLIAGLYLRGMVLRYDAGWESTFLGPSQVQAILGLLFGPLAAWSGMPLPAVADLERLRWTAAGGGGDAAPWIHLTALALACYVVVPRLCLAAIATATLAWRGRAAALPPELRSYAAGVFRRGDVVRAIGIASVTPYAYDPSEASFAGLRRWLQAQSGGAVRLERRSTLRYGEEDMAAPAFDSGAHRVADLHVLLLNLAATPEEENHGAVIDAARDSARRVRPPAAVRVVVDESPYAARLARDMSLAPRLEERRRLWRDFVAGHGLEADLVHLERSGDAHGVAESGRS